MFKQGSISPNIYTENIAYEFVWDIIIIKVQINEKTYRFLLDTGAPTTINSKVIGDFAFVKEEKSTDASQNEASVNYVKIPKMKFGNIIYKDFVAMQYDIEVFEQLNIDGILGANLISKSTWEFDIENNVITVSDKLVENKVKDFSKTNLKIIDTGTPVLKFTYFNKIKEKGVYFDTGFNGLFYLSTSMFNKLSKKKLLSNRIRGIGIYARSAFGQDEISLTYMAALKMQLGEHEIPNIISDVSDDTESNMGCEWLKYYHTIISGKEFFFKRNKTPIPQKVISKGIRLLTDTKGLFISMVWEKSEAYKKGIRPNDRILSVNKKKIVGDDEKLLEELKRTIYEEKKIILEINKPGNYIELEREVIFDIQTK